MIPNQVEIHRHASPAFHCNDITSKAQNIVYLVNIILTKLLMHVNGTCEPLLCVCVTVCMFTCVFICVRVHM